MLLKRGLGDFMYQHIPSIIWLIQRQKAEHTTILTCSRSSAYWGHEAVAAVLAIVCRRLDKTERWKTT